jgi:DNA-binding NtrC family response regulator
MPILSISADREDHAFLEAALAGRGFVLRRAFNYRQACAEFRRSPFIAVICEKKLSDGSWHDVLSVVQQRSEKMCVIVTAESPDDALWAEVFNLGGYDLLSKPFDSREIAAVMDAAARAVVPAKSAGAAAGASSSQTAVA